MITGDRGPGWRDGSGARMWQTVPTMRTASVVLGAIIIGKRVGTA